MTIIEDLLNGFRYRQMRIAREWIAVPPPSNPCLSIVGDYDCDGVCSVAIMDRMAKLLGWNTALHTARRSQGYGAGDSLFTDVMRWDPSVIVFCDIGTNDLDGIKRFIDEGRRVIIIDHHEPEPGCLLSTMPHHMVCLLNPLVESSGHSRENLIGLCTAGLARIFAEFVMGESMGPSEYSFICQLACVGTVGDMANASHPINDQIISEGLAFIKDYPDPAVSTIVSKSFDKGEIDYRYVAFNISPVINAPGKIYDDANSALAMFTNLDRGKAIDCANYCIRCNEWKRQEAERCKRVALKRLECHHGTGVVTGPFPTGIVGQLANKLLNGSDFKRCICVSDLSFTDIYKGSCRGEGSLDYMKGFREHLVRLGGHKGACGFTIEKINLEKLYDYVRITS